VRWKDSADLESELDDLRLALGASGGMAFLTAASPGIIASFMENQYYSTEEEYLFAIADAMRTEYRAVVEAGFLLQVDCPDLAITGRTELQIAALNRALDGLPPERLRMHLCWGNYEGPHHKDVPLAQILPAVYTARPAMISFEGANPRHAHEWVVFRDLPLPEGKVIMPGLIDTTTNFIEHPELIAQRIERYASVVGRDRVIASTDCGMSTGAGFKNVDPEIAWAKLGALSEGARLASVRF
jgi:5-methyltetrahydropteroyltriglutamate--homocysteine methyltransferase